MTQVSRLADLTALAAAIDEEIAAVGALAARLSFSGTTTECAAIDARSDRLACERAKVRDALKAYEAPAPEAYIPDEKRVWPRDVENAKKADVFAFVSQREINGMVRRQGGAA